MSSRYDRINTAITQIPIQSAVKVFGFLDELFENKFNREFFKQLFWNFDTSEQHFICYYLDIYLSSVEKTSFLNKWLEEKELVYSDADALADFHVYKEELTQNKKQLVAILDSYKKTAERRFKMLIKHKVSYDKYSDYFNQGQINSTNIKLYQIPWRASV